MTKTKFFHVLQPKRLRSTFAIDVCDKKTLEDLTMTMLFNREPAKYEGKFGVALVNPKDRHFVKSIGRAKSVEKSVPAEYHLVASEPWQDGTKYTVAAKTTENLVRLNFFVKPKSQVVHVTFVDVPSVKRR
jgi:hypothetical protein